jgi:PAS domain-containing protein
MFIVPEYRQVFSRISCFRIPCKELIPFKLINFVVYNKFMPVTNDNIRYHGIKSGHMMKIIMTRFLPMMTALIILSSFIIFAAKAAIFKAGSNSVIFLVFYMLCSAMIIFFTIRSMSRLEDQQKAELEKEIRERTSELMNLNEKLNTEIAERIEAEKASDAEWKMFNDVLELMPAYIILLTSDYHVHYANRFFRERFGESGGRRCFEYLFNRTEPCEICETYKVLKENRTIKWDWSGPDNRIYSIYDFPFTASDGSTMIMEMGIDVTNLKITQSELQKWYSGVGYKK